MMYKVLVEKHKTQKQCWVLEKNNYTSIKRIVSKPSERHIFSVLMEMKWCVELAHNDNSIREKSLNKFREWISSSEVRIDNSIAMLKLWKGLFYSLWHSDKPLIQEECANSIGDILLQLKSKETYFLFIRQFYETMNREWHGIDRYRINKFYMLFDNLTSNLFFITFKDSNIDKVKMLLDIVEDFFASSTDNINTKFPSGLRFHFIENFWRYFELNKNSKNILHTIDCDNLVKILSPLVNLYASSSKNKPLLKIVLTSIFQEIPEALKHNKPFIKALTDEVQSQLKQHILSSTINVTSKNFYKTSIKLLENIIETESKPPPIKKQSRRKHKKSSSSAIY